MELTDRVAESNAQRIGRGWQRRSRWLGPETGNVIWKLGKVKAPTACSVAADKQRIYFGGSDPFAKGPLFALTAGSSGDLTPEKTNGTFAGCAWTEAKAGPGMASPVCDGQYLYVADNNILRCYDAQTGQRLYQNRLPDMKLVAASPLIVGDMLLIVDEGGTAVLVKVGKEFEVVVVAVASMTSSGPLLPLAIRASTCAASMRCIAFDRCPHHNPLR